MRDNCTILPHTAQITSLAYNLASQPGSWVKQSTMALPRRGRPALRQGQQQRQAAAAATWECVVSCRTTQNLSTPAACCLISSTCVPAMLSHSCLEPTVTGHIHIKPSGAGQVQTVAEQRRTRLSSVAAGGPPWQRQEECRCSQRGAGCRAPSWARLALAPHMLQEVVRW